MVSKPTLSFDELEVLDRNKGILFVGRKLLSLISNQTQQLLHIADIS